jgi:hypothetical protein
MDCRVPGFPENTCRADCIRKILEQSVIARAAGEEIIVAA